MPSTSMPAAATPSVAAGALTDPNERFLREKHPEVLAARAEPHAFVPSPFGDPPDHVCGSRCFCDACWEPKGNRAVHPRRLA